MSAPASITRLPSSGASSSAFSGGTSIRANGGDAHHLALGEHRDGAQLDFDARRILGEIALVEADDLGHVLALTGEGVSDRRGALGHEPSVGAVDQHRAAVGIERRQEARKRTGLNSDHGELRRGSPRAVKPAATDTRRCGP